MVRLIFTDQYANLLLLLNGLVILVFMYGYTKKKQRTVKFGNYETLKKVAGGDIIRTDLFLAITRVIAISALLIGLSSPVIIQEVQGVDTDYVLTLDKSASMFTGDPSRFNTAQEVSQDFLTELGNSSEVGLITFAGDVSEDQELTSDLSLVRNQIEATEIGETPGTASGDAVASGVSMLMSSNRSREVILVTDGTHNRGQSIGEAADFASRQNVTVNPIGISDGEEDVDEEDLDEFGTIRGEEAARADFNNLNESRLQSLANETGGEAVFISDQENLEPGFLELETQESETDASRYLILLAAILLVLDAVYRTTDIEVIP